MNDAERRVRAALEFRTPDRVPRYDSFWPEFTDTWRVRKGLGPEALPEDYYGIDLAVVAADETPWPSAATSALGEGETGLTRDGWGRTLRSRPGAQLSETLAVALPEGADPQRLEFESPQLPGRYSAFRAEVRRQHARRAVFAKTGGAFLRTANLRGEEQWLVDLATDVAWARELAGGVNRHLTAVGLESLRQGEGCLSGIWIYDDIGTNAGPIVSPRTFARVFQPLLAEMVAAYKGGGAQFVIFHSDGNIMPLVDMIVEAGVDAIQPLEPKAGMDALALRQRFGDRLALIGGLDNAHLLPGGDRKAIAAAVERLLGAGTEGGLVLGSHSIGPDVAVETYDYLNHLEDERGRYPLQPSKYVGGDS